MKTLEFTPSVITPVQEDLNSAIIAGKKELRDYYGGEDVRCGCDLVGDKLVRVTAVDYGMFTIIQFK